MLSHARHADTHAWSHRRAGSWAITMAGIVLWCMPAVGQVLHRDDLTGEAFVAADRAYKAIAAGNLGEAVEAARAARRLAPASENAARLLIDALSRAGKRADALAEANRAIAQGGGGGQLLATRGHLRRGSGDPDGAAADFAAALAAADLDPQQRQALRKALEEARYAGPAERAFRASAAGRLDEAIKEARAALAVRPKEEGPARVLIDALSRSQRKAEALAVADRVVADGVASGRIRAQRANLRRERDDLAGAIEDFEAALRSDIEPKDVPGLRYGLAEARAIEAERKGNIETAALILREAVATAPKKSDAWFALGYLLARNGRNADAGAAFAQGLALEMRGSVAADAGRAYLGHDAPKASHYLRQAAAAWRSGDPTLAGRDARELEGLRNEIVDADASIRVTLGAGFMANRPVSVGGAKVDTAADVAVRFDGRYLPSAPGLEVFGRAARSRDETHFTESVVAAGLRWQPFRAVNLVLGAEIQHRFDPTPLDQFALLWGYGVGTGLDFPLDRGWRPFASFGAFGSYRFGEERLLQDVQASAGFAYAGRAPMPFLLAPGVLAVVGYDNTEGVPWASGIGPSLLWRAWLGGDADRGYDAILTVQLGYLLAIGKSERQVGPQAKIGLTF